MMEKISRENYEVWFMDYLDGQLSETEINHLLDFLLVNPDLKEELHKLTPISLVPGTEIFPDKSVLLRNETDTPGIPPQDYRCIARMEGDLPEDDALAFDRELEENRRLGKKYAEYQLTRLKKDNQIVFPDHRALKKKNIVLAPWIISVLSVAAMIAVVLLLWPRDKVGSGTLVAEQQDTLVPAAGTANSPVTPELVNTADTGALLAASTGQPSNRSTGNQEKPARTVGPVIEELPVRPFIPMESLAYRSYLPSIAIPNPVNSPVLYAARFSIPDEKSAGNPESNYISIPQYALRLFRERILGEDPVMVRKTRFSAWEVADAGLDRFNALIGWDMNLDRQYSDDGNLVAVSFNSRLLDFEKPVRSSEK